MKNKLTLSIDEKLIRRAKAHSRRKKKSLSGFIEDLLENALQSPQKPEP